MTVELRLDRQDPTPSYEQLRRQQIALAIDISSD